MQFLKALSDFKKLCSNEQAECATACRVYLDLILDKQYNSIIKCYDSSLNVFYLKAETWDNKKLIILPSLISQDLDLNTIHKLQSEENNSKFLLALCDTSSNILYYRKSED